MEWKQKNHIYDVSKFYILLFEIVGEFLKSRRLKYYVPAATIYNY